MLRSFEVFSLILELRSRGLMRKMSEEREWVTCPYNEAHVVLKSRMASHLIKCRPQPHMEVFEPCPFNATHRVPSPELQYHIQTCPDRRELENYLYVTEQKKPQPQASAQTLAQASIKIDLPIGSENWDEEKGQPISYLDVKDKKLEKKLLFRQPVGMSKSERKLFFKSETERFEKVSEDKLPSDSDSD